MAKRYPNTVGHKIVIQCAERLIAHNNKMMIAHRKRIDIHEQSISLLQKANALELSKKAKAYYAMKLEESDA